MSITYLEIILATSGVVTTFTTLTFLLLLPTFHFLIILIIFGIFGGVERFGGFVIVLFYFRLGLRIIVQLEIIDTLQINDLLEDQRIENETNDSHQIVSIEFPLAVARAGNVGIRFARF